MRVHCTRCDFCGEEYPNRGYQSLKIILFDDKCGDQIPPTDRRKLDVCPLCANDIRKWIDRKRHLEDLKGGDTE